MKETSFAFPTDHEDVGNTSVVCRLSLEVLSFPLRVSAAVVTRTGQASAARGENPLAYRADSFGPSTGGGGASGGGSAGGSSGGGGGDESSYSSSSPAWTFSVSLRDCGEADFLVSERRYNQSVARAWKPKERVMMEWREEEDDEAEQEGGGPAALKAYFGVVSKIEPESGQSETWPNSPWGCLTIRWDMDGSTNTLGPWEPRPVSEDLRSPVSNKRVLVFPCFPRPSCSLFWSFLLCLVLWFWGVWCVLYVGFGPFRLFCARPRDIS